MPALDTALPAYPVPTPRPAPPPQPPAAAPPAAPAAAPAAAPPMLDMNSAGANFAKAAEAQKVATERTAAAESRAAGAKSALQEEQGKYIEGLHSREEQELRGLDQGEFKPTHDTLAGMGALFTMVGMMGAFLGGKGTSGAAANAQAALTGIIGGWNKGEDAEVARQKMIFDENANYLKQKADKVREIYRDYEEDALKVGIPTAQGRLQQRLVTEAEADVNAAKVHQAGAQAGAKQAEDIFKMADAFETKKIALDAERQRQADSNATRLLMARVNHPELSPEAQAMMARNIDVTGAPLSGGRGGQALYAQAYNKYAQMFPGKTPGTTAATYAADKSSLTQVQKKADTIHANEQTMIKNMGVALEAANHVEQVAPFLNKYMNTGATSFGSEKVPPYAAAVVTVADQYAKILSGGTGAQGATDSNRRQAVGIINDALNRGQLASVFGILKQDAENQRQSFLEQRQEIVNRIGGSDRYQDISRRPVPTAEDLDYVKKHPEKRANFVAHFGVEP